MDPNISLKLRLKYFDTCVPPAMLYGLTTFPMSQNDLKAMDVLQRKMLRRIIGWRRIDTESWRDTMLKMNQRLLFGQSLHFCEPWSISFARAQWRYVHHIIDANPLLWARFMCRFNFNLVEDFSRWAIPHRNRGRPRMRWDDNIHSFCWTRWPHLRGCH